MLNKYKMGKVPTDTFKNYVIYLYLMFEIMMTVWLCGYNDQKLLKYWFVFTLSTMLITRIYSFYRKGYLLFMLEFCYAVNIASMFLIFFDFGLVWIYPFLHGPLMLFSLLSGDALILHDLDKSTSFAVHVFGSVITRRLYWNGPIGNSINMSIISANLVFTQLIVLIGLYMCWLVPYTIFYMIPYNGPRLNMIKYMEKIKNNNEVTFKMKMIYIIKHAVGVIFGLMIGIFSMYCWQFNSVTVALQISAGIIHGGWYYYKEHKFKLSEAREDIAISFNDHVKIDGKSINFVVQDTDQKYVYVRFDKRSMPVFIKEKKS